MASKSPEIASPPQLFSCLAARGLGGDREALTISDIPKGGQFLTSHKEVSIPKGVIAS